MSNHAGRSKRLFAGFLAAVLALTVVPILGLASPAGAAPPPPVDPIGAGNFCEDAGTTEPFTDVSDNDPARAHIACLVATQITTGVTATTYEPNSFVTRRQMALFLVRTAAEADRLEIGDNIRELPAPAANTFTDVAAESQSVRDAISQLDQAGVANGFPDNTYRPGTAVSRRQMAAFIDRLYEYLTGAQLPNPGPGVDHFSDDNNDSAAAQASTNRVAEAGIFTGNTDGTFRPAQEITRRQMAFVLTRFLQVLFENGEINKFSARTGAPPASNQAFRATEGSGPAINTVSSAPGTTNAARGARTYTFEVPNATSVDIALVPVSQSDPRIIDTNGTITFRDANSNNRADGVGVTNARITEVNGVPTGNNTDGPAGSLVSNVQVTNGRVTFTVNSSTVNTAVQPIVFEDTNNNNELDLVAPATPNANPKAASERFGVGGIKVFLPEEAPFGTFVNNVVILPIALADRVSVCGPQNGGTPPQVGLCDPGAGQNRTFLWDANDQFRYSSSTGGPTISITQEQFESWLSGIDPAGNVAQTPTRGDRLTVNYNPGGVSTFEITRDVPMAPGAVTATAMDTDNDGAQDDVRVTFTRPSNPDVAGYVVFRAPVVNGTVGTFQMVNSGSGNQSLDASSPQFGGNNVTFNDQNLAPGTYAYRVLAFNGFGTFSAGDLAGLNRPDFSPNSNTAQATVAASAVNAPFSVSSNFTDAAFPVTGVTPDATRLSPGDRITFTFNQPITVAPGATVEVMDFQGDAARLTNGGNATFSAGGTNGQQLIIDVTGTPTATITRSDQFINTVLGREIAVLSSTGITSGTLGWNLPESGRTDCPPLGTSNCGTAPNNTRTRVFSDNNTADNSDLPIRILPSEVTVNTNNETVRINPGATTIQNGETFTVFNGQGVAIATATYNSTTGTTVTVSEDIGPGSTIYVVYRDSVAPGVGQPSQTLRIPLATDAPVVTNVTGTGNTIQVTWSEPVRQVGPAANYTVFNSTNSVQIATGTATNPTPGSATVTNVVTVTLNTPLTTGTNYNLRVAPVTVNDLDNNPNPAQTAPFTAAPLSAPVVGAVDVAPRIASEGAFSRRLNVTWDQPVALTGPPANFTVVQCTNASCTTAVPFATGTAVGDNDNDELLVVTFDNATGFATGGNGYRLDVAPATVNGVQNGQPNPQQLFRFTPATPTTAPTALVELYPGVQTFNITFNRAMNQSTLTAGDIVLQNAPAGGAVQSITWNAGGTVATVGVNYTIAAGNSVRLNANSVSDTLGNEGPVGPSVSTADALLASDPTFARPGQGTTCTTGGGGFHYRTYTFTLTQAQTVQIDMGRPPSGTGRIADPYVHLYNTAFNPAAPCTNWIEGDDDDAGDPTGLNARIVRTLPAGTYVVVATSFSAGDTGSYSVSVGQNS